MYFSSFCYFYLKIEKLSTIQNFDSLHLNLYFPKAHLNIVALYPRTATIIIKNAYHRTYNMHVLFITVSNI